MSVEAIEEFSDHAERPTQRMGDHDVTKLRMMSAMARGAVKSGQIALYMEADLAEDMAAALTAYVHEREMRVRSNDTISIDDQYIFVRLRFAVRAILDAISA